MFGTSSHETKKLRRNRKSCECRCINKEREMTSCPKNRVFLTPKALILSNHPFHVNAPSESFEVVSLQLPALLH